MRIYDDQLARRANRPGPAAPRSDRALDPAMPNGIPSVQALDATGVIGLQRSAGNAAVTELLAGGSAGGKREEQVGAPKPRLDLNAFAADRPGQAFAFDKSENEKEPEQDQDVDVGTFSQTEKGLRIIAEADGAYSSTDFPDGFKFTQTIETNVPLHGATAPYVDPQPKDDEKPFYWTDAEQQKYPTSFRDHPKRKPPTGSAMTYWQATLALNGVNEETKSVTGFDYITYGFIMDAAGNIKLNYPANVDGEKHRQALTQEWSSWKFD